MSSRCWSVVTIVWVILGVAADGTGTSYPEMRRGTRLNEVHPDTTWPNATPSANNVSSEGLLMRLSRSAVSLLRECGINAGKEDGNDVTICLKLAAVRAIDKISKMRNELPLAGGVVLVPGGQASGQSELTSSFPSPDEMPRSVEEKQRWVDKQLLSRVSDLLGSFSFRFHLPSARSISDFATQGGGQLAAVASSVIDLKDSNNLDTGRGKGHFANAGLVMGFSLLSMLALLVGKALSFSVLAFALPASRFLQSLTGRGGSCH